MNNWNYRIQAHKEEAGMVFQMHEVYYEIDNKTPTGYTENPAIVIGDDMTDISWTLVEMRAALMKPVLWAGDLFPQEYKP